MESDGPTIDPEELLGHAGWMRALARGLLNDASRADDVVQDAWVAAVRQPPREKGAAGAWLARVVRNFALRARAADSRRRAREERVARPERDENTPDSVLQRAELHRTVVDAVLGLDEPFRTTVLLRFFEGRSTQEIARRERVHVATVRWRLRKALDTLRERLDRQYDGRRAAWHAIMLPLALPPAFPPVVTQSGSTATASSATALKTGGIIAMSTGRLVFTVAASIAFLAVGFFVFQSVLTPDPSGRPQLTEPTGLVEGVTESVASPARHATGEETAVERLEPESPELQSRTDLPDAVLAGSVRDASGEGIVGARVVALDLEDWGEIADDGELDELKSASHDVSREFRRIHGDFQRTADAQPRAETDASGVYRFAELDGGEYRLVVTHRDYLPSVADVHVPTGGTTRHDFELAVGLVIRGRVVDGDGQPLASVAISAELFERIRSDGYAFQIEMNYRFFKHRARVKEIPFFFLDRERGVSKLTLRITVEAFWIVWWMRLADWLGRL